MYSILREPECIEDEVIEDFIDITDYSDVMGFILGTNKDEFVELFANGEGYESIVSYFVKSSRAFRAAFLDELEEARDRVESLNKQKAR